MKLIEFTLNTINLQNVLGIKMVGLTHPALTCVCYTEDNIS